MLSTRRLRCEYFSEGRGVTEAAWICDMLPGFEPAPVELLGILDEVLGMGCDILEKMSMKRESVVRTLLAHLHGRELAVDKARCVTAGRSGRVVDDLQRDRVSRHETIDCGKYDAESRLFTVCHQRRVADVEVLLYEV